MKKRILTFVTGVCLVVGMMGLSGCGVLSHVRQSAPILQTPGAKADLELDVNQSAYPYLMFFNQGSGQAQDVHVYEGQSGQELIPLGLLQKSGNRTNMQPVTKPLNIDPGAGVQVQLNSKDLRAYTVKWKENGKNFSKDLVLKEQQKIETH